ncbi:kinase-like domain-containing protein [Leptodontidium sp. 2 PMI_412]|nr:kinase-like domain-containing protein [Leptodontidium sp. 2 PMI_412]
MSERNPIIAPVLSPKSILSKPSLSINDTPLRRFFVLATLRLLNRILPRHGPVLMLSKSLCIKLGTLKLPAEAATMQLIAKHTLIPVPRVYCAFERKGCKYILMERVQGHILRENWLERSAESKEKVLAQIKNMADQMRQIPCPSGQGISNVAGRPLFDGRLPGGSYHGPFDTVLDFHKYLREGYEGGNSNVPEANRLVERHNQSSSKPIFTHGDLNTMNIIVRGDEVVGIIDWETAGWWPEYWEYTSAWHVNPYDEFWRAEVDKFLEPREEELEMERVRRKYFKDF